MSKKRNKKLLFVVNDASFFVSHRLILGRAAKAAGFDVYVAAPWGEGVETIGNERFRFIPVRLERWGMNPLTELASIAELVGLYRRVRPDIVHHVTIKPVLYGSIAARIAAVPAVVNAVSGFGYMFLHRGVGGRFRRFLAETFYRTALHHPNSCTIFQNRDDRRHFEKRIFRGARNSILIRGSGVDLEKFESTSLPEEEVPTVMLVARVLWDKGIGEFVRAAKLLRSWGVHARFVVVGPAVPDNPSGIPIRQIERWLGEGGVEFWGKKNDVVDCLHRAHLVCLPSYREGLPKVLLEAAACGRGIVATDVPGCREVVRDGYNGLLVQPRSAQSLADGLMTVLSDRQLLTEMGANSRKYVENGEFSEHHVVQQTLGVYRALLHLPDEHDVRIVTLPPQSNRKTTTGELSQP